jgi:hypothetical protein
MAGTWAPLTHQPPNPFNAESMILLTDGSVLVHDAYNADWRRLTPDNQAIIRRAVGQRRSL